jgi:hypothetical protein
MVLMYIIATEVAFAGVLRKNVHTNLENKERQKQFVVFKFKVKEQE